jgi:hypothetical protein
MGAHVELELPTLPEHPSSALVFSGVRVAPSLVFCVVLKFYRSFFFPFSFVVQIAGEIWSSHNRLLLDICIFVFLSFTCVVLSV